MRIQRKEDLVIGKWYKQNSGGVFKYIGTEGKYLKFIYSLCCWKGKEGFGLTYALFNHVSYMRLIPCCKIIIAFDYRVNLNEIRVDELKRHHYM